MAIISHNATQWLKPFNAGINLLVCFISDETCVGPRIITPKIQLNEDVF